MNHRSKPPLNPAIARYAASFPSVMPPSIGDRIIAFLDGQTHGDELLHALYDYVLEEPIPEAMRALLTR